jgi:hypothetical protein
MAVNINGIAINTNKTVSSETTSNIANSATVVILLVANVNRNCYTVFNDSTAVL